MMQVAVGSCHTYMKLPNNRTRQKSKKKKYLDFSTMAISRFSLKTEKSGYIGQLLLLSILY